MASTRELVRVLRRCRARILSRSGGGGCTHSGRADVSETTPNGLSSSIDDLPRDSEGESSTRNETNIHPLNHHNRETFINSNGVRAISDVQHELQTLPNLTLHAHLFVGEDTNVRSEALPAPALRDQNRAPTTNGYTDDVGMMSDLSGEVLNVTQPCTGPAAEGGQGPSDPNEMRQSQTVDESGVRANESSTKIAAVLAGLPLSKVKVVIGELRYIKYIPPPNARCSCKMPLMEHPCVSLVLWRGDHKLYHSIRAKLSA